MSGTKTSKPVIVNADNISTLPLETFPDPSTGGTVSWKTLISQPKTPTDTFTVGIARCGPGKQGGCRGHLRLHRHKQAEIYHVISGKGIVMIEGEEYEVRKGSVVWIPGDAAHVVRNAEEKDLVWLYVFAADGFGDVVYRFNEPGPGKVKARL